MKKETKKMLVQAGVGIAVMIFLWLVLVQGPINRDEAKRDAEAAIAAQRASKINLCQSAAYSDYDMNWESECEGRSLMKDCSLPIKIADSLDETLKQDKDRCLKIY